MSRSFNYEEIFMGLSVGNLINPKQILKDDYRIRFLVESRYFKKGKILDVGCGGGTLTESLAYFFPKACLYGCDISRSAIAIARKSGKNKVKYEVINKKLPYKQNYFDLVICLDTLEHVPDVDYLLKEVNRILKKNGIFYLAVPCEGQLFTLTHLFHKIKLFQNLTFKYFGHIHPEFTHEYIQKLLERFGFQVFDKNFSFHFLSQIFTFFQYYLPKEILELIFGKEKAESYSDRFIIKKFNSKIKKVDLLMIFRNLLFKFTQITKIGGQFESRFLSKTSFTAGKLLVFAKKIDES